MKQRSRKPGVALERAADPLDLDQVDADAHGVTDARSSQLGQLRDRGDDPVRLRRASARRRRAGTCPCARARSACPCRCAPTMSPSRSSPTIQVSSASASSASSAAVEVRGARLAEHGRLDLGRVLEPGDERARVEQRPARRLPPAVLVQAVELGARLELGERAREVHVARRRGSSPRSRRRRRSGRRRRPRRRARCPSRSSTMPGIVSASTRLPCERVRRGAGGRLQLVVVELDARSRGAARRAARRECVVLFVTKRSRWPVLAQPRDRLGRAGDRLRRRRAGRRRRRGEWPPWTRESIQVTRSVSMPRSEIELRFSRSSGPGGQHAQKSDDARRGDASTSRPRRRSPTRRSARVLAKAGPVLRAVAQDERSQWRNRELATERLVEPLREALKVERRAAPDEADEGVAGAAARAEAATWRDEAPAAPARLSPKFLRQPYDSLTTRVIAA